MYSKIERGERRTKCEQINENELVTFWLADKFIIAIGLEQKQNSRSSIQSSIAKSKEKNNMPKLPERILSIIENGFANKEHKLIGNQDFTADEYSVIVDAVTELCQNNEFKKTDYKLIFFTLVEIAKRWKDSDTVEDNEENSGFWRFVFKTLTSIDAYNQTLYSQFTSLISEMGRQNQIPVVQTGKKYYATLMMHAFAPKKSIHSFFDLCYTVFKKDLDFGFTSDDEWLCEIVALQIASVLRNGYREDRSVSIGLSAYSIKIGLRSFALNEDLKLNFVKFITDTFCQINQLFTREKFEENTRLKRYIVEWWKNKTENEKVSDNTTRKKRIATVSKQNIVAKYIRNDDKVFLCIPPVRLDNEKDTMQLFVYINDEQYCSEEMRTTRGELVVSTKEKEFDLNNLLKYSESINIQVKITENEVILYDSKETLNREFILFEDEKEISSQINKPSNYFVYSRNIDALKNIPKDLTTYSSNLYNIYSKAGESLTGAIKQVLFADKANIAKSSNTICLLGNLPDIEWSLDDIHCVVYKDSVKLIVPENTNLKALELKIDNKTHKLENLNHERMENNAYIFGLLKLGLLKQNGPVELSIYSYEKDATVLTETLIVLPNLNINFNKSVFYGDIERKISVSSENESSELSWSNQDNEIICPLSDGKLLVKIPYLRWRVADKEWHNEPIHRKLWYKDLLNNGDLLEIDNPREDEEIKLFVRFDGQKIEITKNQIGKYEIGRAIYANEGNTYISVYCENARSKFNLFIVATKEHFVENPTSYINGKVYWNVEETFVGDKDNEFLLDVGGKNIFRKQIDGKNKEILNYIKENIYRVTVKIKNKNIFSKDEKWDTVFEGSLMTCKPEKFRFKNKYIHIEKIYTGYSGEANGNLITPSKIYIIRDLEYFEIQKGEQTYEYYLGKLKIVGQENSYIDYLENENGEKDQINPVRIELRSDNSLWLLAGYDKENDDFLGALIIDTQDNTLCNINSTNTTRYKIANLYKFKEEEDV
ncbi:MAG: hypothetical protein MdMp024_1918 [Bacteroidales bacterium]